MPVIPKPEEASVDTILDAGVDLIASLLIGKIDADGRRITDRIGSNTAVIYLGERFAIRDYCWCDRGQDFDEEPPDPKTSVHLTEEGNCPANFEHYASGLRLSWYKRRGRSEEWENLPDTQNAALGIILDIISEVIEGRPSKPRRIEQRPWKQH